MHLNSIISILTQPAVFFYHHKLPFPYQAVELRDRALVARVADIPDFDTPLATRVHMSRGVADGNCAHNFPMVQSVDLTGMARDSWTDEGIGRERNRLHLAICSNMKGVGSFWGKERKEKKKYISKDNSAKMTEKDSTLCFLSLIFMRKRLGKLQSQIT